MIRIACCTLIAWTVALWIAPAVAKPGKGHGRSVEGPAVVVNSVHIGFLPTEVRVVNSYWTQGSGLPPGLAKRGGGLPPGLAKQLRRNGQLPPGLQKKLVPFPVVLERQLHPLPTGYHRVMMDGYALLVHDASNVVVDLIQLSR